MSTNSISFVSLGLVVLDEIRFSNKTPLRDVVGGSGVYATLGARLFLPAELSSSLGLVLRTGNDFPSKTRDLLESWGFTLVVERDTDKPSTRGLLEYKDITFGPKTFRYTTTPLQVPIGSLKGTPLLASESFHFLEIPDSITNRVSELLDLRELGGVAKRPIIIWEPSPLACNAENLQACIDAARVGDVISPNHIELALLFGERSLFPLDQMKIESLAQRFLDSGVGPEGKGIVVIRAGENGCLVAARNISFTWLPPFYGPGAAGERDAKVVDATGAGNAFLGAFGVGYVKTGDAIEAACYGAVAASLALEQVGMPEKSVNASEELWNFESVLSRLRRYRRRIGLPEMQV
ncbi:pfkB family carbohydrate kinase superfamily [Aspergillus stella-maris]|uniref:pfkB family carbohydrate kinase superfamily n=1 Tax=Aspergillus stella-maris TaxID=1810926 RepID=UPI003CCE445D